MKTSLIAALVALTLTSSVQAQDPPPIGNPSFVDVPPFTSSQWQTSFGGGSLPWTLTSSTYVTDNGPAAISALLSTVGQKSEWWIVVPNHFENGFPVSHDIIFYHKTGTQHPSDEFTFSVGGIVRTNIPFSSAWEKLLIRIPPLSGTNMTLLWRVKKNVAGADTFNYLDAVGYTANYTNSVTSTLSTNLFIVATTTNTFVISWRDDVFHTGFLRYGSTPETANNNIALGTSRKVNGVWSMTVSNTATKRFFTPEH